MKPAAWASVLVAGALFGFGLAWSTMVQPESVLAFLRLRDFGLMLVLGSAAGITALAYQLLPRLRGKPLFAAAFSKHPAVLDKRTVLGAAIFGVGWGICGVCPGPAIASLGVGNWPSLLCLLGLFAGAYLHAAFEDALAARKRSADVANGA